MAFIILDFAIFVKLRYNKFTSHKKEEKRLALYFNNNAYKNSEWKEVVNMEHKMKLQPKYYHFILNGTKRIEIRLFDEKRQKIKIGDTIKFLKEPDLNKSFNAKVTGLLRYNSFEDMFKDFDISILSDESMKKEQLIGVLERFYTKEKQEQYGVLGIRIELL